MAPLRGLLPSCYLPMSFNIKNFVAALGLNYVHHSSSSVAFVVLCSSSCLRFLNICSVSGVFLLGDCGTPNACPPAAVDLRSPIMSNEKVIKVSTSAFIFFFCCCRLFTFAYLLLRVKNVCFVLKKSRRRELQGPSDIRSLFCAVLKNKKQKVAQIARVQQMQLKVCHDAATRNIFCIHLRAHDTYSGCMTTCDICYLVPHSNSRAGSVFKQRQLRREWTDLGTRW